MKSSAELCGCRSHNGFLTAKGLEEAAQRFSLEGLAPRGELEYVDSRVSVSALVEVEDDLDYDETHKELNELVASDQLSLGFSLVGG